ncbi:hypothetical protein CY35_13G022700 [Sphagnum magellanicum]|nr:hypothetical protein CY35_13G022700 [Sphagnum magellanicum]KAH9542718.1 hypothetical protein CY35_13G022700 [Sphagnum magellanicum]KAH9542719.1 hypothetical protein CY35_13G022700 [Sphagnum magellanicum]
MTYMAKLKNRGNERQWCHFRDISPASGVVRVCCVTRHCRIHESVRETGRREEDLEVACMVGTMPGLVFCGLYMCSSRGCDMHKECNQAATGKCERLY